MKKIILHILYHYNNTHSYSTDQAWILKDVQSALDIIIILLSEIKYM